ncbi:ATP synthase gamma chain [Mycobacterium xenopi 3993]|nr:ATP synthase gamma chain [Mycobacterium xenopi 3993]
MAATLRELRGRIRSAGSIKKITRAQELIATSRITKAQARLQAARPYAAEITRMLTTLATEAALDHPLLVERPEPKRAGVLVVSSDRGLCGAYNASVLRRAEELFSLLREEGKAPVLYVVGRKALSYYSFRNWDITESWTGFSEQPKYENAVEIASTLVETFMAGTGEGSGAARLTLRVWTSCTLLRPNSSRCCRNRLKRGGSHPWSWSTSKSRQQCARSTRSNQTRQHYSSHCCRGI